RLAIVAGRFDRDHVARDARGGERGLQSRGEAIDRGAVDAQSKMWTSARTLDVGKEEPSVDLVSLERLVDRGDNCACEHARRASRIAEQLERAPTGRRLTRHSRCGCGALDRGPGRVEIVGDMGDGDHGFDAPAATIDERIEWRPDLPRARANTGQTLKV